jgi:hypothetical protein
MSLQTTLTFTCDKSDCTSVVSWCQEEVQKDESKLPELGKYLVMFNQNGVLKTFCCQLHAAESFLPPGYEAVQKKVVEISKSEKFAESTLPWFRRPEQDERTVICRSESDPVPQADGDSDNTPEEA